MNELHTYKYRFLSNYCPGLGLASGTIAKYKYIINGFLSFCAGQEPEIEICIQLNSELFNQYLSYTSSIFKRETVKKIFTALKHFMAFLLSEKVILLNPLESFRLSWTCPTEKSKPSKESQGEIRKHKEAFLKYCSGRRRLSPHSLRGYNFDLEFFLDFFESHEPPVLKCSQIDKTLLEEYLKFIGNSLAKKTIKRRFACLMSFISYLEYEEIISENPFDKFKLKIKDPLKVPKSMTLCEVDILLQVAYGRKARSEYERLIFVRDIAILEMLFAGGMRVAELCSLTFSDYEPLEQSLLIHGKGSKERLIFLMDENAISALNDYLKIRNRKDSNYPYIFLNKYDRPLTTQDVRNVVTKCVNIAALKKNITPHSFRHTFASLLLEEGVDIKYIQEFLGHSNIVTTQIYLHTTPNKKREILQTKHPREKLHLNLK